MTRLVYLSNVTTLKLDPKLCNGCRNCTKVCPHGVVKMSGGRAGIVEADRCMECGACARNCEQGAITVSAGVGCAAAIIGSKFRADGETCCGGPDSTCC